MCVYGQGGAIEYWYKNAFLIAQQHRVYALDQANSGKSDKPQATDTLDDLSQFIVRFMDAVCLSYTSLIAGSVGGIIALKIAVVIYAQSAFPLTIRPVSFRILASLRIKFNPTCVCLFNN
jgi:hypothetical protein